jgi:hypothetical protein
MRNARANITRESVERALWECQALGREDFLRKYGYRKSNAYTLRYEGEEFDTKAILGVAFGYEYDTAPLSPTEFSGGAEHCARLLSRLGFDVRRKGDTFVGRVTRRVRGAVRTLWETVSSLSDKVKVLLVGLVSCTKAKLPEAAPARELYSKSWNFRQMVKYLEGERECDEWLVLSAKHGLVEPGTVLEPYEETLDGAPKARRDEWGAEVRKALEERYEGRPVKFVLMAGRNYSSCVEGLEAEVERPMAGLGKGIGPRRKWLAQFA